MYLATLWAVFAVFILTSGARPDGYFLRDSPADQWQYPYVGVFVVFVLSVAELGLFTAILRPRSYSRSWGRALAAVGVSLALFVAYALALMHMPHYVVAHALWIVSLFASCLVILCVSSVSAIRQSRKASAKAV